MNKKTIILDQSCGIGDIWFCQGIANHFIDSGHKVLWPIQNKIFDMIEYLNSSATYVRFDDDYEFKDFYMSNLQTKSIIESDDAIFIPLGNSSHIVDSELGDKDVMKAKYKLCGLDYNTWKDNFSFNRNVKKENELFYDVLSLKDDDKYFLINEYYVTPPDIHRVPMQPYKNFLKNSGVDFDAHKNVHLDIIEGFTVFDWCKVFEKSLGILTIDTCIQYITEKLNLVKNGNMYAVPRHPNSFFALDNVLKTWRWLA